MEYYDTEWFKVYTLAADAFRGIRLPGNYDCGCNQIRVEVKKKIK